jgi:hypothetical protein
MQSRTAEAVCVSASDEARDWHILMGAQDYPGRILLRLGYSHTKIFIRLWIGIAAHWPDLGALRSLAARRVGALDATRSGMCRCR